MPYRPGAKYQKHFSRQAYLQQQKDYNKIRSDTDKEYKTARWIRLRRMKLNHNPLCERCQKKGIIKLAVLVHHIKPVKSGGVMYDMDNLMSLCHDCHILIHQELNQKGSNKKEEII